jgi:hypothetical protein
LELSIENRWRQLTAISFAKRRNLRPEDIPDRLEFTDRARYDEILQVINERIVPLAQVRNALAHGQWANVFTENGRSIDSSKMATLKSYSLWRVILEKNLLDHLVLIMHDALITELAHERDFDTHVRNLRSTQGRIEKGGRVKWERTLMTRHGRRPRFIDNISS